MNTDEHIFFNSVFIVYEKRANDQENDVQNDVAENLTVLAIPCDTLSSSLGHFSTGFADSLRVSSVAKRTL